MKIQKSTYRIKLIKKWNITFWVCAFSLWSLMIGINSFGQQSVNTDIQNQPLRPNLTQNPDVFSLTQQTTVPQLKGMRWDRDNIATFLDRYGLQLGEAVPMPNNDSIDLVTAQSVPAGGPINQDVPIDIIFATEIPVYEIPDFKGMHFEEAQNRIEEGPFSNGDARRVNSDEPEGIVVRQQPEAGTRHEIDTRINLFYSGGIQQSNVRVPPLIGETVEYARERLSQVDLIVGRRFPQVSEKREGTIIDQNPKEGEEVPRGTPVDITIAVQNQNRNNVPPLNNNNQDKHENGIPLWIYWAGGILAAGLIGGFIRRAIKSRNRKKPIGEKDVSVELKPVWDTGKQIISTDEKNVTLNWVHLKYISDSGTQTLKTN